MLAVSPLGLGLAALGRPGYINLGHAADLERDYAISAMETRAHRVLAAARRAGMGVIVKEALANGRLTPRNTRPEFSARLAQLARQANRLNCTADALALAAVLAQPWADVVLSGAATVEHLQSNMRALTVPWDDEAAAALAAVAESPELYWKTRQLLAWN